MINSRERQTNDDEDGMVLIKSVSKNREKRFKTTQSRVIILMKVVSLCDLIIWSRF
jgi:hypothetical protein